MSEKTNVLPQPPEVHSGSLAKRKLLQAELLGIQGQIRNFSLLRDRLSAEGGDATGFYQTLKERQGKIGVELEKLGAAKFSAGSRASARNASLPGRSLLDRPIAPARFIRGVGVFGFGSSGIVQMAPAEDDINIVASGTYPTSGSILSVPGTVPGAVSYSGLLSVGPDGALPGYDPTVKYFWLRTWKYLVPFPPPTTHSRFTYSFDVFAGADPRSPGLQPGMLYSFVSVGETAQLLSGGNIPVTTDVADPLYADLSQPSEYYNGIFGFLGGQSSVQRSFMVGGGNVPGVAIVVGVAWGLAMASWIAIDVNYSDDFPDSGIAIYSNGQTGRINYSYEPQFVEAPPAEE